MITPTELLKDHDWESLCHHFTAQTNELDQVDLCEHITNELLFFNISVDDEGALCDALESLRDDHFKLQAEEIDYRADVARIDNEI